MKTSWISIVTILLIAFGSVATAGAAVVGQTVGYTHDGVQLEGYLAYDDAATGKRPGVLVVHEWWGLNDYARSRARQLAELGYVAFALDMYGKGKVTRHPEQASEWMKTVNRDVEGWRARAAAGLAILRDDPRVDASRLAAIGYCFGGATVQQLAYAGAELKAVVSFHGALVPPPEPSSVDFSGSILICHGADDPFAKPEQVQQFLAAMGKTRLDWQMVFYGGARHSFTNPEADQVGMEALRYNARADMRSWQDMRQLFDEVL
ncbi:MAG: dienelactone hydrolase family protein [Desulfobacteraceae bacterium]|nr:dienelactone hydrolase family protein [Desulfobacteraceae bacterium]